MGKMELALKAGEGEVLEVLGTELRFLCDGARTAGGFSVMEVRLPKDQGPPPHEHPWDEAYYVLSGEVEFQLGATSRIYATGDFLYAPGGLAHAFKGASAEPARVLVMDVPAASEAFFRDIDREVRDIPADLSKAPAIGARHNLRFLQPA